MNIAISIGKRAVYVVYPDRDGTSKLVRNGSEGYFNTHVWCDGKRADFGAEGIKKSYSNYNRFYPDLISELQKPVSKRRKFAFGKTSLGLSGILALLFRDIKQKIIAFLIAEKLIHMTSEQLSLTLVLPDHLYQDKDNRNLLITVFKVAGFQIKKVIPEYLAAVYAYKLNFNRSRQLINVLQIDVGHQTEVKYIQVDEDGNILIQAQETAEIGIPNIEALLREYIESEFKMCGYEGHDNFPESLDLDERIDYEHRLILLTDSLMSTTEEKLVFKYCTKQNETIELSIILNDHDSFIDLDDCKFVFPTRIMQYCSTLRSFIERFLAKEEIANSIDKLIFTGAGCRIPSIVDDLKKKLNCAHKVQFLNYRGMDYDSILAYGGVAYSDANDYEDEYITRLSDSEKSIVDLIRTIDTEPWIICKKEPIVMARDVRYDFPANANHILIKLSDKEKIRTKIEEIQHSGEKSYFDGQRGNKTDGIECLDVNQFHICLSELESKEMYFIAESDADLTETKFRLDIADMLNDSYYFVLDSQQMKCPEFKNKKLKLIRLYPHSANWRVNACLEVIDTESQSVKKSAVPKRKEPPIPPPPAGNNYPQTKPGPKQPNGKVIVDGERVVLSDYRYTVEITGLSYSLFVKLLDENDKELTYTSKTQSNHAVSFSSENSVVLSLNLLEKSDFKRASVCLKALSTVQDSLQSACQVYSAGAENEIYTYNVVSTTRYAKVLEFYHKNGKWKLFGEVEALPESTGSSGVSESSNFSLSGNQADQLMSGERFSLPSNINLLRIDFVGQIDSNLNLKILGLDNENSRIPIWKLERNNQIHTYSDMQNKVVSLCFDISELMLEQYICVIDNCKNCLEYIIFTDGDTHIPLKMANSNGDSCLNQCNNLFKLYKYKDVWKIGYLCD